MTPDQELTGLYMISNNGGGNGPTYHLYQTDMSKNSLCMKKNLEDYLRSDGQISDRHNHRKIQSAKEAATRISNMDNRNANLCRICRNNYKEKIKKQGEDGGES